MGGAGELVEFEPDQSDVIENADGSAIVLLDEQSAPTDQGFEANLAERLSDTERHTIASKLLEQIKADIEARKDWEESYADAIKAMGFDRKADDKSGLPFDGASRVVMELLPQAVQDFAARMIREQWPLTGPASTRIAQETIPEELEKRGERVERHMNLQLTVEMPEARGQHEQLLMQLGNCGMMYTKPFYDASLKRPVRCPIRADELVLNYGALDVRSAIRVTHIQRITDYDYQARIDAGMYLKEDIVPASPMPEISEVTEAIEKTVGISQPLLNDDGLRHLFEVHCYWDLGEADELGGGELPYIVTIDEASYKAISVYRNWKENDPLKRKRNRFVAYHFQPWYGPYSLGLYHLIGGLHRAATGALRALLDAAMLANMPTALGLSPGSGVTSQAKTVQPGTVTKLDVTGTDDIRKGALPLQFPGPSDTLLQLLGILSEAARRYGAQATEAVAEARNDAPVGTTLALIEEGHKVFSAIHARVHASLAEELQILADINGETLDDQATQEKYGEVIASREDYGPPIDVLCVSDPNIWSDMQRVAQMQAVGQLGMQFPQRFNASAYVDRMGAILRVPGFDELFPPDPVPQPLDPASENVAMVMGQPVEAYPEQDHLAYLAAYVTFAESPVLGGMLSQIPPIATKYVPSLLMMIGKRVALWYLKATETILGATAGVPVPLGPMAGKKEVGQFASAAVILSLEHVQDMAESQLASVPPVVEKAVALMKALMPQVSDPVAAQAAAEAAETARKAEADRMKAESERVKNTLEQAKIAAQRAMNAEDNATAKQIAVMRMIGMGPGPRAPTTPLQVR